MNFYSSLIYIAFFKGRFYEYPGDIVVRQSEFYKLKGNTLKYENKTVIKIIF